MPTHLVSLILMILLCATALIACDRETSSSSPETKTSVDAASSAKVSTLCTSRKDFLAGACCWERQTRAADGSCSGVPSVCPEPLMIYPPGQTCDACAGSPSCSAALAACGPKGQKCLAEGARFVSQSKGLKEDLMRATSLFLASCEAGNLLACSNAGIHYERGVGAPRDTERATALFMQACPRDKAIAPGCNNLARIYRLEQKHELADELLATRCEKFEAPAECSSLINRLVAQPPDGDPRAHQQRLIKLGELACKPSYQKGCTQLATLLRTFSPDDANVLKRATTLLDDACAQDVPAACLELGKINQQGITGQEPDLARAFVLYEKACKLNVFAACGPVAMLYLRIDVPVPDGDLSIQMRRQRARQLGQLACTQGELSGCNAMAILAKGGDEEAQKSLVATRAQVKAQCVSEKSPMGCALLGEIEVRGLGGPRELKQGLLHLEQACKSGVVGACQRRASFPDASKRLEELKLKNQK